MHKAAELAQSLERLSVANGMTKIDESCQSALYFDVINDAMCIMHDDGSVNIVENMGHGRITTEVISAENILRVLHHYRPFKTLFKGKTQ